jgi:antitoxin (DNA-binding transcriptional repressor) of toxin-antitoxin stability system
MSTQTQRNSHGDSHKPEPATIGVTEFKQHCLRILEELGPEGLVVTKRGKPIATVMPTRSLFAELHGKYRDQIKIKGDIFTTGRTWDAQS